MDAFDVNLDRNVRKRLYFGTICPKQTGGECEECAKADQLFREARAASDQGTKKTLEEQGRALYAKSRIFINAINVKDEDKSYPVHIYALPPLVYDELIGIIKGIRQLDPARNVFHPVSGSNVLITKRGSGVHTRYTVQVDSKSQPIPNQVVLESLKNGDFSVLHNLNDIEEFLAQNYLHITACDSETNIIRLMPPFEDQTIYREIKFHRFSARSYQNIGTDEEAPTPGHNKDTASTLSGPGFDSSGKQDEFNLYDVQDVSEKQLDRQPETSTHVDDGNGSGQEDIPNQTDPLEAIKKGIESVAGKSSDPEMLDIIKRVQEIGKRQQK